MVLKGKLIFTILFIISIFDCYAFDMLSGQEPFEMSSIIIKEDGIAISAQRIFCTEDGIEITYDIKNSTERKVMFPAKIECIPLGFQRIGNEIPIPLDFKILVNDAEINFDVYYCNQLIKKDDYYKKNKFYSNNEKSEIFFNLTIPSMETISVKLFYKNLQNHGANQTGTNFKYVIKLHKNLNNIPIDYFFTYKNLKSAEAYIDNLIIYDYKADTISKIQYNIELNNGDLWTFRLSNCNLKNDDFYILVFLTIFDLSLDATNIRITSYNNMENIYFNEKELSEELIKQQDLFFLSNKQLRLLRNAFYAIHGYDFKSQDLKEYFSGFSWYKPNPNFSESDFTEIERKNIELIRQMENQEETIY